MDAQRHKPNVMLTQMRHKVSRAGASYIEGRLGLAKVLLLQSNKTDEDGTIFSAAKPAPAAAAREENGKAFEFDDNIDDLRPGGRA
jgi:hypothetical protein